jgi:thiol-disulfide isomerase/thioredoxin
MFSYIRGFVSAPSKVDAFCGGTGQRLAGWKPALRRGFAVQMTRVFHLAKPFKLPAVVCLLTVAGLSFLALESRSQLPVIQFVKDPDPAPDFKAKDLSGNEFSLESYKGKVVLLNFWATWCGPCRAEIPGLVELQERYKDRMQILGMAVDVDDESDLRAVIKSEGINYPVAVTSVDVRLAYGGISALPTVFVISPAGKVVQKHVGLFNPALYETEVRALLDMPINAQVETFEDTGEVFLKHADRATMLPGVNMSNLTPEQRMAALRKLNAESCDCGCNFTLAQCRIYDPVCHISKDRAAAIVKAAAAAQGAAMPSSPTATTPPKPAETPKQ